MDTSLPDVHISATTPVGCQWAVLSQATDLHGGSVSFSSIYNTDTYVSILYLSLSLSVCLSVFLSLSVCLFLSVLSVSTNGTQPHTRGSLRGRTLPMYPASHTPNVNIQHEHTAHTHTRP